MVSASDSQSRGFGFESRSGHLLDLFCRPEFKSSASLVNSQLVASCQLGFLILLCFYLDYLFQSYLSGMPVN